MSNPQKHVGDRLFEGDEYQIIACETCGFAHCVPIPATETMNDVYTNEYYNDIKPDEAKIAWHRMTYRFRIQCLESLVAGRRMLDVGSGPGFFLSEAKKRGWKEQGYELSDKAWAYSTQTIGVNVIHGELPTQTEDRYDAAYLGLVLEHIPDPIALLKRVRSVLEPGGALCIAVPNDFSLLQQAVVERNHTSQWWITPPHHINYFSFQSLDRLLSTCGFTPVRHEGTFPLEVFALLGKDYITDPSLGKEIHGWRAQFESLMCSCGLEDALHDIYATLARHGLGRECVVYAKCSEQQR